MRFHLSRTVICITLFVLAASFPVAGQQLPVEKDRIQKLVGQLAHDDWRVREKAQKQLILIGAPAVPFLKKLSDDPVFEVRFRIREILAYIHVVEPEDADAIDKLIQKYDPKAEKKELWRLVIDLRRKKNVRYYLIEKIIKSDEKDRDKLAALLAMVEYSLDGRTVDGEIALSSDILLSIGRDDMLRVQLRLCAIRGLSHFADADTAFALADMASSETGKVASASLEALKSIRKKYDKAKEQKKNVLDWWSDVSQTDIFVKSLKHLAVRKKFEEEESAREIPFLGVVKNEAFPDRDGAHVERPWPGSGAIKAGVQAGDIIIEFDGRPVNIWSDMVHGIRRGKAGQKILLKILRGSKVLELETELTKRIE